MLPLAPLRIAAAQASPAPGDLTANVATAAELVRRAQARVVVLPEKFLSGYEPDLIRADPARYAVTEQDPRLGPIAQACRDTGTVAVVGAATRAEDDLFISALVFGPSGDVLTRYDKQFLFGSERTLFQPGTAGRTLDVDGWRLGLGICYDCGFAEHARAAASDGAHAYLVGALFSVGNGFHESRTWLPARALDNTVYVLLANHVGPHRRLAGMRRQRRLGTGRQADHPGGSRRDDRRHRRPRPGAPGRRPRRRTPADRPRLTGPRRPRRPDRRPDQVTGTGPGASPTRPRYSYSNTCSTPCQFRQGHKLPRVSRILIAATGGSGRINPLLPFADAYADQGHDVLLIGPSSLREATSAHPVRVGTPPPQRELDAITQRLPHVSHAEASALVDREIFGRLTTAAMLPTMLETCREWQPDLVLREPCEYASAVVAEEAGIPHAQVAISLAALETGVLDLVAPVLPTGTTERIRAAPYLTRFPESLDPSPFPATHRFHERPRPTGELPDWWPNDTRPLVYLTLGTVAGGYPVGAAAYRVALTALADLPVRVLLTVGRSFDAASLDPVPANAYVTDWVPQADVLAHAALVICHGGSGTTFGALAAGVPVVVLPMFADQSANGRLVAASGVGRVVEPLGGTEAAMGRFGPDDVPAVRAAIEQTLSQDACREAAQRVADELSRMPDVAELASLMIQGGIHERR